MQLAGTEWKQLAGARALAWAGIALASALSLTARDAGAAAIGSLDGGFHGDGVRILALDGGGSNDDFADAVHVLSDGRVLVAGTTRRGTGFKNVGFVTRLEHDGSIDFGFGAGGTVLLDFGGTTGSDDQLRALAAAPDGRIVVAGSTYDPMLDRADFAVARLLPDGTPDPAFGEDGLRVVDFVDTASFEQILAVALQADGRIVLAGASQVSGEVALVVVRLLQDGTLDPAFSGDGIAAFAVGGGIPSASAGSSLAVLADGRLLIGGVANTGADGSTNLDMLVLALLPDGTRDTAFGDDGAALLGLDRGGGNAERAFAMQVQASGRIVLAGASTKSTGDTDMALVGVLPDGQLDTGFGDGGARFLELDRGGGDNDAAHALVELADGSLLVAGTSNGPVGDPLLVNDDVAVVVLDGDGLGALADNVHVHALDRGGASAVGDSVAAAALAPDGSVVLAGSSEHLQDGNSSRDALVMRVLGPALFSSGFED